MLLPILRKALKQAGDAEEIRKYVRRNRAHLSALSIREALKNIGRA